MPFCPECGDKLSTYVKFCTKCGQKVDSSNENLDKPILTAEETRELDDGIPLPKGLMLISGEKLLVKHKHFYASNKRIVLFRKGISNRDVYDLSYKHIKGIKENRKRPLLAVGSILGALIILFALYLFSSSIITGLFTLIFGLFSLFVAFKIENHELFVIGVDGSMLIIPQIESESGKMISQVIRTQLYGR